VIAARIRTVLESGRRRVHLAGGERAHIRRGQGYEFAELREYVSGDDPRRIDWAASARAGALQTRVMIEDSALVIAALIDTSPSMSIGRNTPLISRADAAAEIWFGMCRYGDRALRIGASEVFEPRGVRGPAAGLACAQAGCGAAPADDFAAALKLAARTLPRGAALFACSDSHVEIPHEILLACNARLDCTFALAADPWRDALPLRGFARVRDAETNRIERMYFDDAAAARYVAAVAEREAALREQFASAGWRFGILADEPERALLEAFDLTVPAA
jgi:uncharacterized protein (DUF58 family)